jgi:hypothetical protein
MSNMSAEDEALNRAIEASLQDMKQGDSIPSAPPRDPTPEPIRPPDEQKTEILIEPFEPPKPVSNKPPPPSKNPPRKGMVLKTVIKNGWLTQEWR